MNIIDLYRQCALIAQECTDNKGVSVHPTELSDVLDAIQAGYNKRLCRKVAELAYDRFYYPQ